MEKMGWIFPSSRRPFFVLYNLERKLAAMWPTAKRAHRRADPAEQVEAGRIARALQDVPAALPNWNTPF